MPPPSPTSCKMKRKLSSDFFFGKQRIKRSSRGHVSNTHTHKMKRADTEEDEKVLLQAGSRLSDCQEDYFMHRATLLEHTTHGDALFKELVECADADLEQFLERLRVFKSNYSRVKDSLLSVEAKLASAKVSYSTCVSSKKLKLSK